MTETATFAAGCFWGVQYKFDRRPGVVASEVGYMGGATERPSYEDVCTDETGHAEVCQLRFDPDKTHYEALVRFFFSIHDPTTRDRQGPDVGTQYRSAIFYHTPEQKTVAERVRDELNRTQFGGRIVTEIAPAQTFWRAEEYHQKYDDKHPGHACAV